MRGRKKKLRRKKEERREAREREKERKRKYFFNERGERNLIKYIYIYIFFLALNYSAHLFIDVHCNNEAKKK